jgi:hypothetical protein
MFPPDGLLPENGVRAAIRHSRPTSYYQLTPLRGPMCDPP